MEFVFNDRIIKPNWKTNWGDNIALPLIKALSDKFLREKDIESIEPKHLFGLHVKEQLNGKKNGKLISIGSVMDYTQPKDFVWGTGCIKQGAMGKKPRKVTAVRGPLTRHELRLRGWECPEVYGDPALLIPSTYNLKPNQKYEWGIIPHYIEYEDEFGIRTLRNLEKMGFKIIDICKDTIGFLDELSECKKVLSSSLHGLIISDAYGIPNARVTISNKLVGGHFKFIDYCMSINRPIDWGLQLTPNTTKVSLDSIYLNDKIEFDKIKLLAAAPWYLPEFKDII